MHLTYNSVNQKAEKGLLKKAKKLSILNNWLCQGLK
jgi:hypothetical protein